VRQVGRAYLRVRGHSTPPGCDSRGVAGPAVQRPGNAIAVVLGEVSHALAFREVLAEQAVGVLVGAAFPGVMGRREVEPRGQPHLERRVAVAIQVGADTMEEPMEQGTSSGRGKKLLSAALLSGVILGVVVAFVARLWLQDRDAQALGVGTAIGVALVVRPGWRDALPNVVLQVVLTAVGVALLWRLLDVLFSFLGP